ncbi:MAG: hypothetical protein ABIB55_02630 [Candidatus Nealsonbacteria bacterium]
MQVFELYFNPKKRDDIFLTSSVYTPTNVYEKRLGSLYMAGELTQAMPQNSHLLTNLSSVIKKEYYSSGLKKSCEASLQEALKKGNEFLDKESKNGNVGWLGNLNFSVINFKDLVLNFVKVGDIKIFLVRANELIDLSQNLDAELPHPDPLKIFSSIAEGKIAQKDKIIVLNKRILMSLGKKQKFLGDLARAFNEKDLKQVLKNYQDSLSGLYGICLVLMVTDKEASKQTMTMQNNLPRFSLSSNLLKPFIRFFTIPKVTLPSMPKMPKINLKAARKKIFLVLGLILVLSIFYYTFQGERTQELKDAQMKLTEAQSKAMLAESLLILEEDDMAKALFKETLQILSPLIKRGCPVREEAVSLQNSVKEFLK